MVETSVMRAMIQAVFWAAPSAPLPAAPVMAVPASEMPMTMAIEPVTDGGRTFSTDSWPKALMIRPAAIETRPDMMTPNWAWEIRASGATSPKLRAPVIETMAAM